MEEFKHALLILVNLVLIESLLALAPSWALGTFISRLSKKDNNRLVIFAFISFQLLKVLLFLFLYLFLSVRILTVLCILVSIIGFIPFRRGINNKFVYILVSLMVFSILVMDQPFMEYYQSIPYPFNITTNWYLISFSYLVGIVVFWIVLSWSTTKSIKDKYVNWGGYLMLVFIISDSIFSDFLFLFIWDPFSYENIEIVYDVRKYLNYLLLAIAGILLIKYFIDWFKNRLIRYVK